MVYPRVDLTWVICVEGSFGKGWRPHSILKVLVSECWNSNQKRVPGVTSFIGRRVSVSEWGQLLGSKISFSFFPDLYWSGSENIRMPPLSTVREEYTSSCWHSIATNPIVLRSMPRPSLPGEPAPGLQITIFSVPDSKALVWVPLTPLSKPSQALHFVPCDLPFLWGTCHIP